MRAVDIEEPNTRHLHFTLYICARHQESHRDTNSSLSTMNRRRSSLGVLNFDALPDPGPRFQLGERLGAGVNADVYEAQDLQ
ncbi:hypothetical protein B566_EDAN005270, partial [Ephemera danica]